MSIIDRRPRPSVQEVLATDTNRAPDILRVESPAQGMGDEDVSVDRYFSKDWHDREVEHVWRKCWQMACRGDCRDFRVWAGIMGEKEIPYVSTQRTCDTERPA